MISSSRAARSRRRGGVSVVTCEGYLTPGNLPGVSLVSALRRTPMDSTHSRILIIGTGFAGIGMAVRVKESGRDDFVVLERASAVGGTWRDNTYPGCRCDVPSHLYSFSFAPNPEWSSTFSPQPEIEEYLRQVAVRFGVRAHIRFGHAVESAYWEDGQWRIRTSQGSFTAQLLVSGM